MRQYKPLRGLRVLSFETAFALPAGTRTLADLGAEVVRVAPPRSAEGERGLETFLNDQDVRINKLTLAVHLGHEQGLSIARRLAAHADIVCSNLRPGLMQHFGLDFSALRSLRSDVIVLRLSAYGAPGPWQSYPALGPATEAAGGLNAMIGDETDPPIRVGSDIYADQVAGRFAAIALLAALDHRRRTGEGQEIDLSMHEGIVYLLGDLVLSAARWGANPRRTGNRDPLIAPQGVYPCAGRDEWLALSIVTDVQWRILTDVLDDSALRELALEPVDGRRKRHEEIDAAISAWTRSRDKDEAACLLQKYGIPAGPVIRPSDFPREPQLGARQFLQPVRHRQPLLDKSMHLHATLPWVVQGRERARLMDPRGEGADNARVLKRWLGMSVSDVRRLEVEGALRPVRPLLPPGSEARGSERAARSNSAAVRQSHSTGEHR